MEKRFFLWRCCFYRYPAKILVQGYTDTVTDSEGCMGTNSITINEPDSFSIDYSALIQSNGFNLSCADACDGSHCYTYKWY